MMTSGVAAALLAASLTLPAGPTAAQRAATATPTPPANLLLNGDFEGASARQWNAANGEWVNGRVAEGWTAWWRKPTAPDEDFPGQCPAGSALCQPWHRPEYRETRGIPYTPPRVRNGDNSQVYFTSFGVHEGGLYQKASGAPRGWRVRFSIWVRAWSSDTEDTSHSSGQPSMNLQVGIDPTGGSDPWGDTVIWSETLDSFDEFSEYSVGAIAQADAVTVFFRSRPTRALKHVDVMLDDAELVVIGPPPPTPVVIDSPNSAANAPTRSASSGAASQPIVVHTVQPGDTLFAIAQTYRADLSGIYSLNDLDEASVLRIGQSIQIPLPADHPPTAVPTPPPPAPEPVPVGSLCVGAFEDAIGDGRYNEGDGALPEAAFIVADESGRMVAASATARCFDDLPVGAYAVSAHLPAGTLATTDTRLGVSLTEGARVQVIVGGRRLDVSAGDDASDSSPFVIGAGTIVLTAAAVILIRRRAKTTN
jgi:LysM repeat protein